MKCTVCHGTRLRIGKPESFGWLLVDRILRIYERPDGTLVKVRGHGNIQLPCQCTAAEAKA